MKRFSWILLALPIVLTAASCAMYQGYRQNKDIMDVNARLEYPADRVYEAARAAATELGVEIEAERAEIGRQWIEGRKGRLDYVNIHVEPAGQSSTLVGIQARTARMPMTSSGIDIDFARSILAAIRENLGNREAREGTL